ncbi:MAG: hypothetical protein GY863_01495, partial [bacterium]|nr:hypothetical protein [bacterium]
RNTELEQLFKDKEIVLEKEIKSKEELEKRIIETRKQIIDKKPEEERPGLHAFEALKRDHEQLLATFEEKKKNSDSAENTWKGEKEKYLTKIKELEDKVLETEKAVEEVLAEKPPEIKEVEPVPSETVSKIKEVEPVRSEAVSEIKKPEEYDQYVHSFFTKIKKM